MHMQTESMKPKDSLPILTPRQKQIAYLVSLGLSNPAIAGEVFLAEGTVASHVSDILFLLNIKTRAQLARVIHDNPELLEVSEKPPLCLIGWLKRQRLKAALMLADVIDRTSDYGLKKDLYEILDLLQPNENNQFIKEQGSPLRLTVLPLLQAKLKSQSS